MTENTGLDAPPPPADPEAAVALFENLQPAPTPLLASARGLAASLLIHAVAISLIGTRSVSLAPEEPLPKTLIAEARQSKRIIWYKVKNLPDIRPDSGAAKLNSPRIDQPLKPRTVITNSTTPKPLKQFIWRPAPKVEIRQELQLPNLVAFAAPALPKPAAPKPKAFQPPPEKPRAAPKPEPLLPAAPEVNVADARLTKPVAGIPDTVALPGKPKPRAFVPGPVNREKGGGGAATPSIEAAPELAGAVAGGNGSAVTAVIIGLNPASRIAAPVPEGSTSGRLAAGPEPNAGRGAGAGNAAGGGGSGDGRQQALIVPGLTVRNERAAPVLPPASRLEKPNLMDTTPPGRSILAVALRPGARFIPAVIEMRFRNRDVYTTSFRLPEPGSAVNECVLWFSERTPPQTGSRAVRPPAPWRKLDPEHRNPPAANVREGMVQITLVIRKDGTLDEAAVVKGLDERSNRVALDALQAWQFFPASRGNEALEVDALIEVSLRGTALATK